VFVAGPRPSPSAFSADISRRNKLGDGTLPSTPGSHSVLDLRPSDVVLLEDGVRRSFTIFEAPPSHLTLDLVVMFDVTNPRLNGKPAIWGEELTRDNCIFCRPSRCWPDGLGIDRNERLDATPQSVCVRGVARIEQNVRECHDPVRWITSTSTLKQKW